MNEQATKISLALAMLSLAIPGAATAADHEFGIGVHYWRTVDDLQESDFRGIDEAGESLVLAYHVASTNYLSFEADLEYFDKGFQGADDAAYSPIIYALVGKGIYGGIGVGVTYSDGFEDDFSDAFYAARAGFNLDVMPNVKVDLHGNYRFDEWEQLDQSGSDTITLGALLRIDF